MRGIVYLLLFSFNSCIYAQQLPGLTNFEASSTTVNQYDKLEVVIDLNRQWKNPFDYNEMDIRCIFTSPTGKKDTVDAYYEEPYLRNEITNLAEPAGKAVLKVRFAPRSPGTWYYQVYYEKTRKTSPRKSFLCKQGSNNGFIRKNTTNYLSFDNGEQFIPIGENVNCPDKNVFEDYTRWTKKLAENKANYMNVWMIYYGFGIEWSASTDKNFKGLGKYNQVNAYHLDWLLNRCAEKGLYVQLALNTVGHPSSTVNPPWSENPYSRQSGGPCASEADFFTNTTARQLHKNRLRYILARWGYSTQVMSWNLFVEVDNIDQYKQHKKKVTDWHEEMSDFLKRRDVNNHLVTTSYSFHGENEATWRLPNIDLTYTHAYPGITNPEKYIVNLNRRYLAKFRKPTFTDEFSTHSSEKNFIELDPEGIHLHNTIWATSFGGALGPAATYWWHNYIDPQNLYFRFKPLAQFLSGIPLVKENFRPAKVHVSSRSSTIRLKPSGGWMLATDSVFAVDQIGVISPTEDRLAVYLYGKLLNTEQRTPAIFKINSDKAGAFNVKVHDLTPYAQLAVTVNGKTSIIAKPQKGRIYTFHLPAGNQEIKVENTGNDWLYIEEYSFSTGGAVLNPYVLQSENGTKAAGYILNENRNWYNASARITTSAEGGTLRIDGLKAGRYKLMLFNPSSLALIQQSYLEVRSGFAKFTLPPLPWDIAFKLEMQ